MGAGEPGERLTIASLAEQLGVSITLGARGILRFVTERAGNARRPRSMCGG